jgi:hypothetical protein
MIRLVNRDNAARYQSTFAALRWREIICIGPFTAIRAEQSQLSTRDYWKLGSDEPERELDVWRHEHQASYAPYDE